MNKHRGGVKRVVIEDLRIGLREEIIRYVTKEKRVILKQVMEDLDLNLKAAEYQVKRLYDDGILTKEVGLVKLQGSLQHQRMNVYSIVKD